MEEQIYNLLNFIRKNGKVPKCDELNVSQERLNELVKKCNKEMLLDKEYVYVNILGIIQSESDADLGITKLGINYLEEHNPVGNVMN